MATDEKMRPAQQSGLIFEPKLDWDKVNDIRRNYVHQSRINGLEMFAKKYNVSKNTIHKVVRGITWKVEWWDEENASLPTARNNNYLAFNEYMSNMEELREQLAKLDTST